MEENKFVVKDVSGVEKSKVEIEEKLLKEHEEKFEAPESKPDVERVDTSTASADTNTKQEEVQQEETEKPVKEPSAKEKAATKIVKKIDDKARYDDAAQMKTLIVMQILGNNKTFFDTQSIIVDTNVNEYLNKTIEDEYGILFNMAQDDMMMEMINGQY